MKFAVSDLLLKIIHGVKVGAVPRDLGTLEPGTRDPSKSLKVGPQDPLQNLKVGPQDPLQNLKVGPQDPLRSLKVGPPRLSLMNSIFSEYFIVFFYLFICMSFFK